MEGPRVKRQKVAMACDSCRSRKIKCDGREPVCKPCQRKPDSGAGCTWEIGSSRLRDQSPLEQVRELRKRIKQLEADHSLEKRRIALLEEGKTQQHIFQLDSSPIPNDARKDPVSEMPGLQRSTYVESPASNFQQPASTTTCGDLPSLWRNRTEIDVQPTHSSASIAPRVDQARQGEPPILERVCHSEDRSFHAIIGANVDEDHRDGFFGSSSAGSFMHEVKKMVEQKLDGSSSSPSRRLEAKQDNSPSLIPIHELRRTQVDYVLPPRKQADSLMFSYWNYVHVINPYLDMAQTKEDYDKIWNGDASVSDERSFLCLLNIIFAISCRLAGPATPQDREHSAAVFCQRARELLDVVETGCVRSVQSFLLLGQYFQSTSEPHPAWVFIGLAIRSAQSLGLHLPETSERVADLRRRELLRKVWHGCILMDRVVSMTYGRPCMIGPKTAAAVPLPLATDEEDLVRNGMQTSEQAGQPSIMDFYNSSLRLYEILHDVLFSFHSTEAQTQAAKRRDDKSFRHLSSFEAHTSIFELERRLAKWESSLPDHLKVRDSVHDERAHNVPYHQAVVLQQRQLHVHLILLRPVLSSFITSDLQDDMQDAPFGTLLSHRVSLQCAVVCVRVAQDAIDIIHGKEQASDDGKPKPLSEWWYNVLFLYSSATVLIAARLSPAILAEVSEESVLDGYRKAVEVLGRYSDVYSTSIRRLTTTLRLLSEALPRQYSRLRQQPQQAETGEPSFTNTQSDDAPVLPLWCPRTPIATAPLAHVEPKEQIPCENYDPNSTAVWPDFDTVFDPDDFSWLMTLPLDS